MNTRDYSTRERILAAADALFGEIGFDAAPTRKIAERCGVNKALIHYHFASKQELFNAVLDRYYAELGEVLRSALTGPGPLRERLHRLLDAYVDFLAEHRSFSRMVQREIASGHHIERITGHMVPLFRTGSELVRAVYPSLGDGPLAAPQLLVSFYGMVATHFSYAPVIEGLVDEDPTSPEGVARRKQHLHRMLDLVLAAPELERSEP